MNDLEFYVGIACAVAIIFALVQEWRFRREMKRLRNEHKGWV